MKQPQIQNLTLRNNNYGVTNNSIVKFIFYVF
jgi:hypothetical protein